MNVPELIIKMCVLMVIMSIGYILRKSKQVDETVLSGMSRVAFQLCSSSLALNGALNNATPLGAQRTLWLLLIFFVAHFVVYLLSVPATRILNPQKEDRGIYSYMLTFGNCGFIGFPVITALLGGEYLVYGALFVIPFSALSFTFGQTMISGGKIKLNFKNVMNVPFVCSIIAIFILVFNLKFPKVITDTVGYLNNMSVGLTMVIIGGTMGGLNLKEAFLDIRALLFNVVRMFVFPVIIFFICRYTLNDPIITTICTVLFATPIASNASILAYTCGGNKDLAAKCTSVSTLVSCVSLPLVVSLLLA